MAAIAPWLQGTDVIGAMSRGASAGLSARSEDDSERNAADRLRLAYDQMAQEERRQSQATQIHQQQTAAALLLKKQQAEMLNTYRQGELATRSAAQALQSQHFDELKRHNMAMEGKPRLHNVPGVGLVQEDAAGNIDVVMPAGDKGETDRQKEASQLAAAKLFATDPNSPGYNVATNVAGNILNKYGMMPKAPQTPEEPSTSLNWNLLSKMGGGLVGLGRLTADALKGKQRSPADALLSAQTPPTDEGPTRPPIVGEVRKGYRFLGGDPSQQDSWEKVK